MCRELKIFATWLSMYRSFHNNDGVREDLLPSTCPYLQPAQPEHKNRFRCSVDIISFLHLVVDETRISGLVDGRTVDEDSLVHFTSSSLFLYINACTFFLRFRWFRL